jgi:hypothetical protein
MWHLAKVNLKEHDFITRDQFNIAMKYVAITQSGCPVSTMEVLSPKLSCIDSVLLPKFPGLRHPTTKVPKRNSNTFKILSIFKHTFYENLTA